jgi:MtfA peptidase
MGWWMRILLFFILLGFIVISMFGLIRRYRRARLRSLPFPKEWFEILQRNVPLYGKLASGQQLELQGHIRIILHEKNFEGCGGLVLTDEIRITIAAHAGILLLGRKTDYYPDLDSILVYPSTYHAPVTEQRGHVVSERTESRLGESWRRGTVVLAWDAARSGALDVRDAENVLLHEFAHQLDTEDGVADGVPLLGRRSDYIAWAKVLSPEFERLQNDPGNSVLDEYGAENPAEFFAVATEAFFEKPGELEQRHPDLYAELSRFYRLDPAGKSSPSEGS